jgi:hypothetical protein
VLGTTKRQCFTSWASSLPLSFSPQESSAEESSLEGEQPVLRLPEEVYALPVLPPEAELPDAARVSAPDEQLRVYSAVPRTDVHCALAVQQVWFQDGLVPAVVSPEPEQAGLALSPDDSVLAVPQAGVRSARAAQPALPVQQDDSVALPRADSPQDELVLALPQADWAEPPEQRDAHSQQAASDEADSPALQQAAQVAQLRADS